MDCVLTGSIRTGRPGFAFDSAPPIMPTFQLVPNMNVVRFCDNAPDRSIASVVKKPTPDSTSWPSPVHVGAAKDRQRCDLVVPNLSWHGTRMRRKPLARVLFEEIGVEHG